MNRRLRSLAALAALLLAAASPARAQEDGTAAATAVVDRLHRNLIDIMKNAEALGYAGRYDQILPVVVNTYDTAFMARTAVGRQGWKQLSDEQKRTWLELFRRLTASTYAGRFTGWSGQSFETLRAEPAAGDTVLVRTVLRDAKDGEDVQLNYRLRETDRGWRIIDVYLDGTVSELALRRSEYSSVLRNQGFESLVSSVGEKIQDYASGKSSS